MYVQSFKSVVKLKVISFKDKFSKAQSLDTTGYFLLFQLQTSHVLSHPFEPLSPGFLIPPTKSYIICPRNTLALFFFYFFFQFLSSFPVFMSPLLLSQHLPLIFLLSITLLSLLITTCSGLPGNLLTSFFSPSYFCHRNFFSPLKYYILSHLS